jgi:hypothetical protein
MQFTKTPRSLHLLQISLIKAANTKHNDLLKSHNISSFKTVDIVRFVAAVCASYHNTHFPSVAAVCASYHNTQFPSVAAVGASYHNPHRKAVIATLYAQFCTNLT